MEKSDQQRRQMKKIRSIQRENAGARATRTTGVSRARLPFGFSRRALARSKLELFAFSRLLTAFERASRRPRESSRDFPARHFRTEVLLSIPPTVLAPAKSGLGEIAGNWTTFLVEWETGKAGLIPPPSPPEFYSRVFSRFLLFSPGPFFRRVFPVFAHLASSPGFLGTRSRIDNETLSCTPWKTDRLPI